MESAEEITEESLALFTVLDPKLDVLVVGHGKTKFIKNPVDPRLVLKMRQRGVNVEVLSTENAVATYNYLAEEGRVVAAALIPPDFVKLVNTDIIDTKERRKELFSSKDKNYLGGTGRNEHPVTGVDLRKKIKDE